MPNSSKQKGETGMTRFDLIIRNALVYDGSGGVPAHLDIAIRDGIIAAIATAVRISEKHLATDCTKYGGA